MKAHLSLITMALLGLNSAPGIAAPGYGYGGNPWPATGYGSPGGNWSGGDYPRESPPWGGAPYDAGTTYPPNPSAPYPPQNSWNREVRPGSYGSGYYYPGYYYGDGGASPPAMDYPNPSGYNRPYQESRTPDYYWGGRNTPNTGNYYGGGYPSWQQNNPAPNRGLNYDNNARNSNPNWNSNSRPRYQPPAPIPPATSPWSDSNSYGSSISPEGNNDVTPNPNYGKPNSDNMGLNPNYGKPNSDNTSDARPGNSANPAGDSWRFDDADGGLIHSPAGGPPAGSTNPETASSKNESVPK